MAKFKVNVISLSLTKNKIAKFGETVEDNQLNGNAEQLVKEGFILPLEGENEAEKAEHVEVVEAEKAEHVEVVEAEKAEDVEVVEAEILKPKKATKK